MDDLYQQLILDHYHNPQNRGELENADLKQEEANASCGDEFAFFIKWGKDKRGNKTIQEISFTGQGCAISTAACSLLTEELKGKAAEVIPELTLEYMQSLLGIKVTLARQKCVMLPVRAMQKLINYL